MDKFVEMVPNWSEEFLGFNQGTLGVLAALVLLVFIARLIAVMTIPNMFNNVCEKSPVAEIAIHGSSKALGTAVGAAIMWRASLALTDGTAAMMPSAVAFWLPSIAQVVMLIAIITGHFVSRFVFKLSSNIGTMTMSWMERSGPSLVRLKVSCDSVLLSLDRYSLPMLSTLT